MIHYLFISLEGIPEQDLVYKCSQIANVLYQHRWPAFVKYTTTNNLICKRMWTNGHVDVRYVKHFQSRIEDCKTNGGGE